MVPGAREAPSDQLGVEQFIDDSHLTGGTSSYYRQQRREVRLLVGYGERNPVIARTLVELGWVRELNGGIDRIYGDVDAYLLNPPTFSEPNNASVMLTLENGISSRMLWRGGSLEEVVDADVLETLSEREIAAVQLAMAHGCVTTKGLADRTGKGSKLCARTLRGLVDKQILVWHGTAPNDPS